MYQKLLQSDTYCSSYRRRRSHMDFFETQCICHINHRWWPCRYVPPATR